MSAIVFALWMGCGERVNTPELAAALAKARSTGEVPTQTAPKALLPFSGGTAHHANDRLALALEFEDGRRHLVIQRRIDRMGPQDGPVEGFRVVQTRQWRDPQLAVQPRDDGREAVFDGQRFASRRRQGPWREREIWRGDHREWLRQAYSVGPALMQAYGPLLSLSRQGTADVAGIAAERFTVRRNSGMRLKALAPRAIESLRDTEGHWFQWLAATHSARHVTGELLRRAGGDEVLSGNLKITGTATVEGVSVPFTLTWKRTIKPLPEKTASLKLPDKLEPARRERPWLMIRNVVRGALADVYAKRARK